MLHPHIFDIHRLVGNVSVRPSVAVSRPSVCSHRITPNRLLTRLRIFSMSGNTSLDLPLEEEATWTRGESKLVTLVPSDFTRLRVSAHVLGCST